MKRKDIKFIIIFVVIVCVSFAYLFQSAYAKYRKQVNSFVNAKVASWKILVNDENINGKSELTNNIVPIFLGDDYTNSGVIAPGSIGYYDIVIDPSNVDVDFSYIIKSEVAEYSSVSDLITTSYIVDPATNSDKITYDKTTGITGTFNHNSGALTIRIYIEWDDSAGASMDNAKDTEVAITSTSKALINTSLRFSQISG